MEQDKTPGEQVMRDKKILVLGCGSIGKRHIRNLIALDMRVAAFDVDAGKIDDVKKGLPVETFSNLDEALAGSSYDAAFICSPPTFHVPQALRLVKEGIHCFIEKPLSNSLYGVEELMAEAAARKRVVLIGYSVRFSRSFKAVKKLLDEGAVGRPLFLKASAGYYLPYWRPHEDYRKSYGASKELGGGIILDASHEIDYIRVLAGEVASVFGVVQKLSNLEIDTEDYAEIIMRHSSGIHSQIHLDYLQTNYRRSCEIVGDRGMILWDLNERVIKKFGPEDKEYHVHYEGLNANMNDMYMEETAHFFRCIKGVDRPLVDLKEAGRVQEIIRRIKDSSIQGTFLTV